MYLSKVLLIIAQELLTSLKTFGFGELDVKAEDLRQDDLVLQLGFPPNRIDLMTAIDGVKFDQAWATRVEAMVSVLQSQMTPAEIQRGHALVANELAARQRR